MDHYKIWSFKKEIGKLCGKFLKHINFATDSNFQMMKRNLFKPDILIISVIFLFLFFYYNIHITMFEPPQSVHVWRQTNCLSLTQQYYQYNLPFLQPEMHNQFGNGGISGKAVGEFPIVYYVVAMLWKVFGKHEWIFQLLHLLIMAIGIFALYASLNSFLNSRIKAGFLSLLVITSPMVIFYGPKFLPDVPALMFVFIAWYYTGKFLSTRKTFHLWISALLFCLAMLLKITSAVSFIALGGWVLLELLIQNKSSRIFNFRFIHFLPFILSLVPVTVWYLYADYYNAVHQGHISTHGIWPIWNVTKEDFYRIIDIQNKIYFKQLFLPFLQFSTVAIWIYLLITIKKSEPVLRYFIIVLPLGFIAQVVLWFQILDYHDYYLINLIVVLVAIWAIFLYRVEKMVKSNTLHIAFNSILIIFFMWNIVSCRQQILVRYVGWMNETYHKHFKTLLRIEPSFEKWGIEQEDKVISIPDVSINTTLYYMNRKGYTDFGSDFTNREMFYTRIEQGAKYLIINDTTLLKSDLLQPFLTDTVGQFENVVVFNIQNIAQNNRQEQ